MKLFINLSLILLLSLFFSNSNSQSTSVPSSIYLDNLPYYVGPGEYFRGSGYFGENPSSLIFLIGNFPNQKSINISYIDTHSFYGYAPVGFKDYQNISIYNRNNQSVYFGYNQIYFTYITPPPPSSSSETETPRQIFIYDIHVSYGGQYIYVYGYFGENPSSLTIKIGSSYNQKSIKIASIDSYYLYGYAPDGFQGYQNVTIYNSFGETVYFGQNMAYYSNSGTPLPTPSSPSSSSSYESPLPTPSPSSSSSYESPSPTPSTSIKCEYSPNGFIINSTEPIQCQGTGPTYCETNSGSTCSTDNYNSTIKCTTGKLRRLNSSLYCNGNNIQCKSSYVTCSINKLQNSYLLVNGIEQKSNYYDSSNPQQQQNTNNSSLTSVSYSSITLLILLISSILIIF